MAQLVQRFFANSISGTLITLIPATGSDVGTGLPPHLALEGLRLVTRGTPDTAFWEPVATCATYDVTFSKVR